jgi:hypothetical protein
MKLLVMQFSPPSLHPSLVQRFPSAPCSQTLSLCSSHNKVQFKNFKFFFFPRPVITSKLDHMTLTCVEQLWRIHCVLKLSKNKVYSSVRDNIILQKHLIYLKYTIALCPGYIKILDKNTITHIKIKMSNI